MLIELFFVEMLAAVQSALDSGQQALQAGDLTRADQLFQQYLSQNPNSAEALSNLGAIRARREQFSEAVVVYEKALKANPKLIPVHFNMAIALGQLKAYDKAAQHLRTFLESYPNEARARQLLGLALLETGDARGALTELETSYKLNPKDGSILYALAMANARAGDADRPPALLRQSQTNPRQGKLIERLIEYRRGRFAEAKALFKEVLQLNPDVVPAITALGRLELLDHNDGQAIRLLERPGQLNPGAAESTIKRGRLNDRNAA